jgi:hypothetical protein
MEDGVPKNILSATGQAGSAAKSAQADMNKWVGTEVRDGKNS